MINDLKMVGAYWACLTTGLILLVLPLNSQAQPSRVITRNYEAAGNLAITHTLKCISLDEVKTDYTPADIYPAFADCVSNERYQEATRLFILAGAYAAFDTQRVTDQTAHGAGTVLVIQSLETVEKAKKEAWSKDIADYAEADAVKHIEVCAAIRNIGAPTYHPAYMIQHGMDAFSSQKPAPLTEPFDTKTAWDNALTTYLQCPA